MYSLLLGYTIVSLKSKQLDLLKSDKQKEELKKSIWKKY